MLSSALDFHLPPELIAQTPCEPRDHARLLHFRRDASFESAMTHRRVYELPELLRPDDLLVFNDTRVLRARLWGRKATGGKVEALLLRERERNLWQALLKPSARLRVGDRVLFSGEQVQPENDSGESGAALLEESLSIPATLQAREDAEWQIRFELPNGENLRDFLPQLGQVPVPPYIKTAPREAQYQTVYAQQIAPENAGDDLVDNSPNDATPPGVLDSCAAPTAGLHFSQPLLESLRAHGVSTQFLTLGVGVGTFRPLQTETLDEHVMHEEEFFVSEETAHAINAHKRSGARVVAVGTTTTRVLESVCGDDGCITPGSGKTAIFIRPGFRFRCVDALMTNFHLPRSTLLALVAAFMESEGQAGTGIERVHQAYAQATAAHYRFFSFGDAMLIE